MAMKSLSYWRDPLWRALRIVSFIAAALTLVLLITVLAGTPWHFWVSIAVAINIIAVVSTARRTAALRARDTHRPD